MSTTLQPEKTLPLPAADALISAQIHKASRGLKLVDLATSLVTLAAGVLGYLLLAIVLDQWVISGGLGSFGRWMMLLGLLLGVGFFSARQIVPLLIRQLNPAFAARELERGAPGLKNSLLNFIFFRQDPRGVSAPVYQAIEQQAAQQLKASAAELTIDQSKAIRVGYFFLGVVVFAALYQVLSPKSPWQSVGRMLAPWADILPASRVAISEIRPGKDVEVVRGERLPISARIQGMHGDEEASIVFSTDDAQEAEQRIPLTRSATDSNLFRGWLPEEESGVSQPLDYRLEAGDARSHTYRVLVIAAPTIWVESVEYEYPEYTGYSRRKVSRQGDLAAIEGTIVTVTARANHVIDSASIDFDCDGAGDKTMRYEGTQATIRFPLALAADRRTPLHSSYCIRFTNRDGRQNRNPARYLIDVTPDLAPEIEFLAPEAKTIEVPLDGQVELELNAKDPDFALADVELAGEVQDRRVVTRALLEKPTIGQFAGKYVFRPAKEGLKAGDRLNYWAIARDNKSPRPNETATETRLLIVTGPQKPGESGKQSDEEAGGKSKDESPDQEDAGEEKQADQEKQESGEKGSDQGESGTQSQEEGEQGEGGQGGLPDSSGGKGDAQGQDKSGTGGKPGEQTGEESAGENEGSEAGGSGEPVASDGTQDGDAFDRIQEHLESQEKQSPQQDQQHPKPSDGDPQASDDTQGEGGAENQPDDDAKGQGQGEGEGEQTDSKPPGQGAGDQANSREGNNDGQGDAKPSEQPSGKQSPAGKPGEQPQGGQGSGDSAREAGKPKPSEGQGEKADDAAEKGGDAQHDKGESGTGTKSDDSSPSPTPENDAEQNNNKQAPNNAKQPNQQDQSKSPGHGKRESDSQGDQSGDKQGGGEEGGGQSSKQPGTGGEGRNTASDQGSSEAEESGQGETSDRAGDDTESASPTGKSARNKPGQGSKSGQGQSAEGDENSGDENSGEEGSGEQSGEQAGDARDPNPDSRGETPGAGERTGGTSGGSEANGAAPPKAGDFGEAVGGDDPNLEYAKQATDLVLKKLEDDVQKDDVDQALLDKLGWNEDELRQFLTRWKQLKQAAQADDQPGRQAKHELEQSLRSLGLRKGNLKQDRRVTADELRNLREANRSPVPPEYEERLRAYKKGLSSGSSGE